MTTKNPESKHEQQRGTTMDMKCSQCQRKNCRLLICSRCKHTAYCSDVCQKQHWKSGHKQMCQRKTEQVTVVVHEQTPAENKAMTQRLKHGLGEHIRIPVNFSQDMSPSAREHEMQHFTAVTKKARKKRGCGVQRADTAMDIWLRCMATSGLVVTQMRNNAPFMAKKSLVEFFRLLATFRGMPSTKQERNLWQVQSHVTCMTNNRFAVDQMLLNAENEAMRTRMDGMHDSPEKIKLAYDLMQNIELEQATYAPLGPDFMRSNLIFCIEVCVQAVHMLLRLGEPVPDGVDGPKRLKLMQTQLTFAGALLTRTTTDYSVRSEHTSLLRQLHDQVNFRKTCGFYSSRCDLQHPKT